MVYLFGEEKLSHEPKIRVSKKYDTIKINVYTEDDGGWCYYLEPDEVYNLIGVLHELKKRIDNKKIK